MNKKKTIWSIIGSAGFIGLIGLLALILQFTGINLKNLLKCEKQHQDTTRKGNINVGDGNINIDSTGDNAIIISQPNGNVEINQSTNSSQK